MRSSCWCWTLAVLGLCLVANSRVFALASTMKKKTILVTGANRGIGKAICEQILAEHPEATVLLGSRSSDKGKAAAQDILNVVGKKCADRLEVVELDMSSATSISQAAQHIQSKHPKLYGIVNNAGIAWGRPNPDIMATNYFGPRKLNEALLSCMERPGGRIVNIASASGPMWLSGVRDKALRSKLTKPWTIPGGVTELDEMAQSIRLPSDTYGLSKAFVNAYTVLLAKENPDLIVNSVTPGFIATDMGKELGATKEVKFGAIPPIFCLFDPSFEETPTGRYYGSDCKRSPLDEYRGPGDPVYEGPDWE